MSKQWRRSVLKGEKDGKKGRKKERKGAGCEWSRG
jgi:hypothetical protein